MNAKNRVVITGIGLVTPVGTDVTQSWQAVVSGRSGISLFTPSQNLGYPTPVSGRVKDSPELFEKVLSSKDLRKTDRFIHLGVLAASEAIRDASLTNNFPQNRERFGAYVGVGIGGISSIEDATKDFSSRGYRSVSPFLLPRAISNEAPGWMSMKFDLQGPTMAVVNACSSGNDAIGQAFRAIQDGYADYMLAGGTESCLTELGFAGFGNMRALSTWKGDPAAASRPFDKNRSGFVMAEGAGILVLEREDLARKRGAKIYAELAGYGAHSDAYHITAIHPEGRGAVYAIESALSQAGANKNEVGYVNAHGTATPMNDPAETKILKTVFGYHAKDLLISSTKSMTGHMLGATGGVEVAFSALAIKNGVLPPTINCDEPDPACDLNYLTSGSREADVKYALSNSFGFGGANSVILLKKYS